MVSSTQWGGQAVLQGAAFFAGGCPSSAAEAAAPLDAAGLGRTASLKKGKRKDQDELQWDAPGEKKKRPASMAHVCVWPVSNLRRW